MKELLFAAATLIATATRIASTNNPKRLRLLLSSALQNSAPHSAAQQFTFAISITLLSSSLYRDLIIPWIMQNVNNKNYQLIL